MGRIVLCVCIYAIISGCASTTKTIDNCGNHVSEYRGSGGHGVYDEAVLIAMYKQLTKGTSAENVKVNLDNVTKNTITESGSIDVFMIVKNLSKEASLNGGSSESGAEKISKLAVSSFRLGLWTNTTDVCSFQKRLARKIPGSSDDSPVVKAPPNPSLKADVPDGPQP